MSRYRLGAVAIVGLVLFAGCTGTGLFGQTQPTPSSTPGRRARSTTPGSNAASPSAPAATQSVTNRTVSAGDESLYRQTIRSVVKIRVLTPQAVVTGSGFVYDGRGDVVTNHHVIANAQSVEVQFANGAWKNATVVGSDAYADLAVVRVPTLPANANPLPVAAHDPTPGEPAAAIGNPFGLTGSITTGVVSGVNRTMPTTHSFTIPGTVQTSAAINPGNSGGPLLSPNGTVIGVNRATKGVNVGFAISPVVIHHIVPQLIANGSYTHAYLGISATTVTPSIASANGLSRSRGVFVDRTLPSGPSAGVLDGATHYTDVHTHRVPAGGDVIVSINGTATPREEALSRYLLLHTHPGERVPLTVVRNGTEKTVHVTLGKRPRLS